MSLSKPFRLLNLPLLPLEHVLLLTEPRDLLLFALSSENARQLLRKFSLVKYFDILAIDVHRTAVEFSICFKSGKSIGWKFTMKLPVNASVESRRLANIDLRDGTKRTARLFKLDGMRMTLWETKFEDSDVISCSLPKDHFLDYTRRIGYFLQSIFPWQRIGKVYTKKVGWEDEQVFFHLDRNTSCDNFYFDMYDGDKDNFLEILEKMDVKKHIFLRSYREEDSNLEWMNNEKIRNISQLHLLYFENQDYSQLLELENESLQLVFCSVRGSAVNEYLKKWMNGEFTKRRTLEIYGCSWQGLDDEVLRGLTPEPMETWEKLGKPGPILLSDYTYLNPTPQTVPEMYQTVLLKNCHGQFATVVQTIGKYKNFYFIQWDHPLPPINIPKGYGLDNLGYIHLLSRENV